MARFQLILGKDLEDLAGMRVLQPQIQKSQPTSIRTQSGFIWNKLEINPLLSDVLIALVSEDFPYLYYDAFSRNGDTVRV